MIAKEKTLAKQKLAYALHIHIGGVCACGTFTDESYTRV